MTIKPLEILESFSTAKGGARHADLPVKLIGTTTGAGRTRRAIIYDPASRSQRLVKVGDYIENAQITGILRGKLLVMENGRKSELKMSRSPRSGSAAGTQPASRVDIEKEPMTIVRAMERTVSTDITKSNTQRQYSGGIAFRKN